MFVVSGFVSGFITYIYIYRERERDREIDLSICARVQGGRKGEEEVKEQGGPEGMK